MDGWRWGYQGRVQISQTYYAALRSYSQKCEINAILVKLPSHLDKLLSTD